MAAPPWLSVLRWILLLTISADGSTVLAFHMTEGSTVILSCHYSVKHHGLSHVCWGRDCGTFWCNNIIVQTDEYGIISKVSDRYKLIGDVLSGQMDLGIQKIQKTDSGPYCCRVDIEGFFNDKKVSYTLRVESFNDSASNNPDPNGDTDSVFTVRSVQRSRLIIL
uniref:T cell immunoglobulin and mucin domain containing 4 n=1 Tax=Cyprinus carpio TaxID=7962 RepID=A0A8C2F6X1_CYPCA